MQMNMPRVSADGKTVAFIGGLMSDWGPVGGDVYTVPLAGGAPVDVTPDFKGTFRGLDWRGGKLMATALIGDRYRRGGGGPGGQDRQAAVVGAGDGRRRSGSTTASPSAPTANPPPPSRKTIPTAARSCAARRCRADAGDTRQ